MDIAVVSAQIKRDNTQQSKSLNAVPTTVASSSSPSHLPTFACALSLYTCYPSIAGSTASYRPNLPSLLATYSTLLSTLLFIYSDTLIYSTLLLLAPLYTGDVSWFAAGPDHWCSSSLALCASLASRPSRHQRTANSASHTTEQ